MTTGGHLACTAAAAGLAWRAGRYRLVGYAILTLTAAVLPVVASWLTKLVMDRLVGRQPDLGAVTDLAVALAATALLASAVPHTIRYLGTVMERAVALAADDRLYTAVNGFVGLRRFEDPAFLDRLRLAQQAGGATPCRLVEAVLGLARNAVTVAGFVGSLAILSPAMTSAVVASAVPLLPAELALARRRAAMSWRIGPWQRRELFYGSLLTGLAAAKEIRLFGAGGFLRGRMRADRLAANAAQRRVDQRQLLTQVALGSVAAAVAGAGLVWAVRQAAGGRLSVGDVSMFVTAVAGVQVALAALVSDLARAHEQLILFGHYLHVVRAGPDLPPPGAPASLPRLRRGIELRDVWFRYADGLPWVLRGVNLSIPHGTAVGLVGLNGAGKSTLVKLLCRFYDPTRGSIRWDGVDLRDVPAADLRRRISVLFQDYMQYDLTAAENIRIGDLDLLDPARLATAARRAGVHETIEALPRGYDTLLSRMFFGGSDENEAETGVHLSGGQWQRLALARALLRSDPDLLILDEPSSGLDAEAEYEIHARLRAHRAGRTSLLISHRLGVLRDADTIVVLDRGRLAERGTHAALIAAGGAYARLFHLQARGYQAWRA